MDKKIVILPLFLFLVLVGLAYHINSQFFQNLVFCISGSLLGLIATFLVVDNYYKRKEEIENKDLLFNLAQIFFTLIQSLYFTLLASYKLNIDFERNDKNMYINVETLFNEIKNIVNQIKNFKVNDYSKYRNSDDSRKQIDFLKKHLDELKDLFSYIPKSLSIYKICFPLLLTTINYFQYFEYRILNNNTMLDFDASTFFLDCFNTFNENFIIEIKKLNNKRINGILFMQHKETK